MNLKNLARNWLNGRAQFGVIWQNLDPHLAISKILMLQHCYSQKITGAIRWYPVEGFAWEEEIVVSERARAEVYAGKPYVKCMCLRTPPSGEAMSLYEESRC